jgi:cell division protein ZapA
MSDDFKILKVNIFGTEYPIKGSTDTEYIKQVAGYVDQKMREIDQNIPIDSSLKVAILAALNITDELFREREKKGNSGEFSEKIQHLTQLLDSCISKYGN